MTIESMNGKGVLTAVQTAVSRRGTHRDELIPILNDINHALGYLPSQALQEVARQLGVPQSSVFL